MGDRVRESTTETVHGDPIDHPSDQFTFRAHLSLAMIALFGAGGVLAIASTADRIDPARAIYDAGIGSCICAIVMVICWGASEGHARLARIACRGHERVVQILTHRLEGIEEIERETSKSVVVFMDEFDRRRTQHGG